MELQEIKNLWNIHHQQAEKQMELNRVMLKNLSLDRIKSKLGQFKATAIIELILNGLFVIFIMGFLVDHWFQWAFVIPGAVLWVVVMMHLIWNIYSLAQIGSMHYGMSITVIQKRIQILNVYQRYQVRSLYVVIPIFFVCFALVIPKALLGIDMYLVFNGLQKYYLLGYSLLGTLLIAAAIVWFLEKFPDKGLINSRQFLQDIAKFESTES